MTTIAIEMIDFLLVQMMKMMNSAWKRVGFVVLQTAYQRFT
jgi:hypothetical protein